MSLAFFVHYFLSSVDVEGGLKNPDKNHRRGQFQGGVNIIILLSCQLAIKLSQSQISCREISTKTWL
ncbi:hypothetical protein E1A91_D06G183100v1 [Gossypium mustelinum]|uniref:Uncharacterized protein n=1 Tax=Gossypium mustelinum TaxID=34275 RepID=A0A5D2UL55_GOSMU|nr:hypothetical protein E1A91_D06G183100v1 [Gossypium mustelinum]